MTALFVCLLVSLVIFVDIIRCCELNDDTEERQSKRRRITVAHQLSKGGIPSNAWCEVIKFSHRPDALTMNALIEERQSVKEHWRDICNRTLCQKIGNLDDSTVIMKARDWEDYSIEFVPNPNLYVLLFEKFPMKRMVPPSFVIKFCVATKLKSGERLVQNMMVDMRKCQRVYLHVTAHCWRIGDGCFQTKNNALLRSVQFVTFPDGG